MFQLRDACIVSTSNMLCPQVLMSMDVPSLSYAVFLHRIAPLIDTAAAAALFIYNPIRWWLSDSHAGTALLLGLLYAMLVQLEVHARYPVSGPEATSKRRSSQRRVHALLLWLLHMNLILGLCSTYRYAEPLTICLHRMLVGFGSYQFWHWA